MSAKNGRLDHISGLKGTDEMCGRYYVDDETAQEIEKIVRKVSEKMMHRGDIYPTQQASILHKKENVLSSSLMTWGFPGAEEKRVLINARSESALEKPAFKSSIQQRRCIIPAKGFYEWDKSKNKMAFESIDGHIIWMAGIWKPSEHGNCFVVLTTAANHSVEGVHDRMPLILDRGEINDWILDQKFIEYAVRKIPEPLKKISTYQQMHLFDE